MKNLVLIITLFVTMGCGLQLNANQPGNTFPITDYMTTIAPGIQTLNVNSMTFDGPDVYRASVTIEIEIGCCPWYIKGTIIFSGIVQCSNGDQYNLNAVACPDGSGNAQGNYGSYQCNLTDMTGNPVPVSAIPINEIIVDIEADADAQVQAYNN